MGAGVSMSDLARNLAQPADRLVVDRTGLTGVWDLDLQYVPSGPVPNIPGVPPPPDDGASLFTALQEQLGLKLEPQRAPEGEPGTMAINLVGSARGMEFYKLSEPPGLVINLPHGYPKPGSRVPGSPFKKLSVQRKGQGSQLRLYFTMDQNADVRADGSGLRVVLRHKRSKKT